MILQNFKFRNKILKNRIVVSPMCQYSSRGGYPSKWHYNHLLKLITSGAGILTLESTAVSNTGKITHQDLCLSNKFQKKNLEI